MEGMNLSARPEHKKSLIFFYISSLAALARYLGNELSASHDSERDHLRHKITRNVFEEIKSAVGSSTIREICKAEAGFLSYLILLVSSYAKAKLPMQALSASGSSGTRAALDCGNNTINMKFGGLSILRSWTTRFSRCSSPARSLNSLRNALFSTIAHDEEVVIAVGSNVGNRVGNFDKALDMMKKSGIHITRHSCLYETEPAYVTEQPLFLNSAVRATTNLGPHDLLKVLKRIETELGRTEGIRYGPRPIDLDIIFYGKARISSDTLFIPHKNLWERPFVLAPLVDLLGLETHNDNDANWHSFSGRKGGIFESWEEIGGESIVGSNTLKRVFPIGDMLLDWSRKTHVMGVLNLTSDSFSDGGKYMAVEEAVAKVQSMISDGADIIDIGAQSTRPGATWLTAEEELSRLLPVLEALKNVPEVKGKMLSVDTFYSKVAYEAVQMGVNMVNDISGGLLDPDMFSTVANLGIPCVLMHMRGDPSTMQNENNTSYGNVCKEVANELCTRLMSAESSGIPAWRVILDPGLGFAKSSDQNIELLRGMSTFRQELAASSVAASNSPLLIGPSRKSFLICHRPNASERDPATIAAVTAGVLSGANIVRVHNVKDNLDAVTVCDALRQKVLSEKNYLQK